MHGEVWRLITYIFIRKCEHAAITRWVNVAFTFSFFGGWATGSNQPVGAFKLTIFYLVGMIGTTIAAFFFWCRFFKFDADHFACFSLRRFYPDLVIYFAYILPMKVKWIAWFSAAVLLCKSLSVRCNFAPRRFVRCELLDLLRSRYRA